MASKSKQAAQEKAKPKAVYPPEYNLPMERFSHASTFALAAVIWSTYFLKSEITRIPLWQKIAVFPFTIPGALEGARILFPNTKHFTKKQKERLLFNREFFGGAFVMLFSFGLWHGDIDPQYSNFVLFISVVALIYFASVLVDFRNKEKAKKEAEDPLGIL